MTGALEEYLRGREAMRRGVLGVQLPQQRVYVTLPVTSGLLDRLRPQGESLQAALVELRRVWAGK